MKIRLIATISTLVLALASPFIANMSEANADDVAAGKKIAFDRKLGNCLACHAIEGGSLPGNIGPPLVAMKSRFPDKSALRAQIYDPTVNNPRTAMPPFGKHGILTDEQIDLVAEFIHTL